MAAEFVSLEEFKKEQERRKKEEEKKSKVEEATEWFNENRELALLIIPAGITIATLLVKGGISLTKTAIRSHQQRKLQQQKAHRIYDYSLHRYWQLKRELTNRELFEIANRKKSGEQLSVILSDLNVI